MSKYKLATYYNTLDIIVQIWAKEWALHLGESCFEDFGNFIDDNTFMVNFGIDNEHEANVWLFTCPDHKQTELQRRCVEDLTNKFKLMGYEWDFCGWTNYSPIEIAVGSQV